jgi:hypothetical protein
LTPNLWVSYFLIDYVGVLFIAPVGVLFIAPFIGLICGCPIYC